MSDNNSATVTQTLTFTVLPIPNNRPQVSISSPVESQVSVGASVTLAATSIDAENGNLSSTIQWSSDKSGALGTGSTLTVSTLSAGMHVLTATSTDSGGAKGIARTTLLVGNPTPIASYAYNALGQRVSKTDEVSENTTHFIYDPEGRLIAEIDAATGDTVREYVYLNGQQVALVDDTDTANEEMYFVHNDHLGTPQKITNDSKQVVWAADYEPFGKADVTTSAIDNNIRFPGQYEDEESGLHYNYLRDYDPNIGRYIESDPIGLESGLNTYAYVDGNPLSYSDPDGLSKRRGGGLFVRPMTPSEALAQIRVPSLVRQIRLYDESFRYQTASPMGYRYNRQDVSYLNNILRQHQARWSKNCLAPIDYGRTPGGTPLSRHYATERVDRNIPVSLVDSIIRTVPGRPGRGGTTVRYDLVNDVTVITGRNGVVSAYRGGQ